MCDVVPNRDEIPTRLVMQVIVGRRDVDRGAMLSDFPRFGFTTKKAAQHHLKTLLARIQRAYEEIRNILSPELQILMDERLQTNLWF